MNGVSDAARARAWALPASDDELRAMADELRAMAVRIRDIVDRTAISTYVGGMRHEMGTSAATSLDVLATMLVYTPPPYP